jgi:recombinational DNA repair ATPase RecF
VGNTVASDGRARESRTATPPVDGEVQLSVQNLGGISEADVTFSTGVTLLSGRNASNKSSLLRSLAGVLGGATPPLKRDADAGEELQTELASVRSPTVTSSAVSSRRRFSASPSTGSTPAARIAAVSTARL